MHIFNLSSFEFSKRNIQAEIGLREELRYIISEPNSDCAQKFITFNIPIIYN